MNPTGGTGGGSQVPQGGGQPDPSQAAPSQRPIMYPNQATNDTTGAGGFSFGTMPTPPPPGGVVHAGAQTQQQPDFGPMQGSDGGGDDLNMAMNMGLPFDFDMADNNPFGGGSTTGGGGSGGGATST